MKVANTSPAEVPQARLSDRFTELLTAGALPGEREGLSGASLSDAAGFIAALAARRPPGQPVIAIDSVAADSGPRRMRLGIVNDDMPFLVDSVSAAIGARGLAIHRLLHPVVTTSRTGDGVLEDLVPEGGTRESVIYLEVDRADARDRRALVVELEGVLADVRAAVRDWPKLQSAMRGDAARAPAGEGAALVSWLGDRHFTMLGHQIEAADGTARDPLGIFRNGDRGLWDGAARAAAITHFASGGDAPLILKADEVATVHRRVPIDLIVLPVTGTDGTVEAVSVHAGLWTSAALRAPSDQVPMLRGRLAAIEAKYGFDPAGHAGKALHHALSALPHDVLVALDGDALERAALTAMSLADRPRPKLLLLPSPLKRHLFAFVWLPRDELSTARRLAIGDLLAAAAQARVQSWAIDLDVGELALIRYTLDVPAEAGQPDADSLDREIEQMVRGWAPAVEAALTGVGSAGRATRLALTYAAAFPIGYRNHYGPEEAANDIIRLQALSGPGERSVRFYRTAEAEPGRISLKIYRVGGLIPLSEAVPVLENFGFRVIEEVPTALDRGKLGYVHDFLLEIGGAADGDALFARADVAEKAIAAVLEGQAESDAFNQLILAAQLEPRAVVLFRAWFRYLRQTGLPYGLDTVASALRRAPDVARALVALFDARHDPAGRAEANAAEVALDASLAGVAAIDDDRILRRVRAVVLAVLRTNAFTESGREALAFKLDSKAIPGLPAPVPWREIWIYSPRVEGIHLRGGPIARGGLRWSDRRDDFRTEILGLMKAQVVKNAVIVPTGAKGGFYPKQLPSPTDRDAWLAEGTESYRIFIRALLSVTDNIVADAVVHPEGVTIRDGDDPYFVVAADKGTAAFSDVANAIAIDRGFWLGDAFASGGSQGYDHKAMGITARGAWISVQRHFAEMGLDVQTEPFTVVGCGDMSGDVFGNGMLLSKEIRLLAAFDHRHIFLDPNPDPVASWAERDRIFALPRSSWADYDAKLISPGGDVFPRTQKEIPLSPEIRAALGIEAGTIDPSGLIAAILKAPVDLLWFGGIGTYLKAAEESNAEVGDPANDAHRVNGRDVRARVVGEGANLGVTQAGRIEYAAAGGRIDTDFIDNSAGVDCSDNEVNIKIALNREMAEGRLGFDDRNALLVRMTDEVAELVLEDNRLQTLALSIAERGAAAALPSQVRAIEILEAGGRLDRAVEGLAASEALLRRAQDARGLTRPELSVLLSHGKLALQSAIEASALPADPGVEPLLRAAFPAEMRDRFADAIDHHRLRPQIIATKAANRVVNRLGPVAPLELAEEEGVGLAQIAAAYFAVDGMFGLEALFTGVEEAAVAEECRLLLLETIAQSVRLHIADLLRAEAGNVAPAQAMAALAPGLRRLDEAAESLLREEARLQSSTLRARIADTGADPALIDRIVRLADLDGAIGTAALAHTLGADEITVTTAYVRLGEALGLDWAKAAALRFESSDPWERLLTAGLARDFEQLRLDFLARSGGRDPLATVDNWLAAQRPRVEQFRTLVARAREAAAPTSPMLAQIASQARVLLGR